MNNDSPNFFYTTEIAGAVTTSMLDDSGVAKLKKDPREFVFENTNIKIAKEIDIRFADNSSDTINLVLPYYELVEKITVTDVPELALKDIDGGEIFISIGIAIGGIIGGVAVAGAGWGAFAGTGVIIGAVVGGTVGAGVSAGIVTGAVVGTEEQRSNK